MAAPLHIGLHCLGVHLLGVFPHAREAKASHGIHRTDCLKAIAVFSLCASDTKHGMECISSAMLGLAEQMKEVHVAVPVVIGLAVVLYVINFLLLSKKKKGGKKSSSKSGVTRRSTR